jgi:hypothetical protein
MDAKIKISGLVAIWDDTEGCLSKNKVLEETLNLNHGQAMKELCYVP